MDITGILDIKFRTSLESSLILAGIERSKANAIVYTQYKRAIKDGAVSILKNIIRLIEDENVEELEKLISLSPSGDCMGADNYYINFQELGLEDIGGVLEVLKSNRNYHGKNQIQICPSREYNVH